MDSAEDVPSFCARCAAPLRPGRGELYLVTIEAVADPSPPVFDADDLNRPPGPEIGRLLARLAAQSERELDEQVRRRLVLHFCIPCYRAWIEDPAGPSGPA